MLDNSAHVAENEDATMQEGDVLSDVSELSDLPEA
jgi:hypothetical protein